MQRQTKPGINRAERKGDTSKTSSQGRKLSSGGDINKKGNPQLDENTKSPRAGSKTKSGSTPRK